MKADCVATPLANASLQSSRQERLSWLDICACYPDEWVVLIAIEYENCDAEDGRLLSALVLGHSKSRAACLRETKAIREHEGITACAHLFTGSPVPPGFVSLRFLDQ